MVDDPGDLILGPLLGRGGAAYLGEPVTQLEHALQTAALAAWAASPPALVVAALLHDIGWLAIGEPEPAAADADAARAVDHARRGAARLRECLPAAVTEPVRLHVEAKRWLCTTMPGYRDLLSDESRWTLRQQGGMMVASELAAFEAQPWAADAVQLRRWDDEAKVPDLVVPDLDHWRPLVASLITRS